MTVKLLTEHLFAFLSLKVGCTGSSKYTLVKMPHCWKSHVATHIVTKVHQQMRKHSILVVNGGKIVNPWCANKSRLLFSSAEMFKKPLWQTVWTQIRLLLGAVCSRSTLFASILNSSVMLGNYLQQTTSADDIFRCIFLGALRVKCFYLFSRVGMIRWGSPQTC